MHTPIYPRIFVEQDEAPRIPEPVLTTAFHGKRSVFGPCVIWACEFSGDEQVGQVECCGFDWHGIDAERLAAEMLFQANGCEPDQREVVPAFSAEVVRKLPRDEWRMTFEEVREWVERWHCRKEAEYAPAVDPDADEELPVG